jgi:hypothetical protein
MRRLSRKRFKSAPKTGQGLVTPEKKNNTTFFQPKLLVGSVEDSSEREADTMADAVSKSGGTNVVSESPIAQRKCSNCEEEEKVQLKKDDTQSSAEGVVADALNSGGQPMDTDTQDSMENSFGYDFSKVKIHTDSTAAKSAQALNAHAYTTGNNIVFNKGQYSPGTGAGRKLLAHELTHVVQQSQSSNLGAQRVIQRMPCAALLAMPSKLSVGGVAAHSAIQADFHAKVKDAIKISIPGGSAAPQRTEGSPGNKNKIDPQVIGGLAGTGFPDLAKKTAGILEVAEIKPADWLWLGEGIAQVGRYVKNGNDTDSVIAEWRKTNGITTVSPMLPTTYAVSTLVVAGTTIQVAWCGPGVLVYKALGGKQDPIKVPEWKPHPVWDKVLLAAMMAAMAAALKKAGMKMNPAMRVASVVALVILLGSGKAEAKISLTGDDPLEALFKAMEQDGVTVPDEVKEMINKDPELKKMIEESAKNGGKLTDVQKAVAKKYTEYINQHIDEFSKEELEAILSSTGTVSDQMPADVDVEAIKKAIKDKIDKKDAEAGGTGKGGGSKDSNEKPTEEKPVPKLSEASQKTLKEAKPEVKNLFDAWLKKQEGGTVKLTDEIIAKFFGSIPVDLSKEDSDFLIAHLAPGGTLDESLATLKQAIEDRKKNKDKDKEKAEDNSGGDDKDTGTDSSSKIPKDESKGGIPRDEYIKIMLDKIKNKNYSGFKGFEIVRGGKKTTLESKKGEVFDAILYQWINYKVDGKVSRVKAAAAITVEVTADKPVTVVIKSSGSLVLQNGQVDPAIAVGKVFVHGSK